MVKEEENDSKKDEEEKEEKSNKLSVGAIIGISVGSALCLICVFWSIAICICIGVASKRKLIKNES